MKKIRNFLWKNLGVTLDKETLAVIGIASVSSIAAIILAILSAVTGNTLFRLLCIVAFVPATIILIGSSYRPLMWGLSDKSERKEIEEEVALKQLKRRVNDKHFER